MNLRFSKYIFIVGALSLSLTASLAAEVEFTDDEIRTITAHGPWPVEFPDDPGNELSALAWAEKLGSSLFNDARLSASGSVSCSSCHQANQGFSESRALAVGASPGTRNTQGLLNAGLQRWFGWGGGADSLWAASLKPLFAPHEMAANLTDTAQVLKANKLFVNAIAQNLNNGDNLNSWDDEAIVLIAGKAIGAYVRTLSSGVTPFDQYRTALVSKDAAGQNQYPDAAKRGLKIFISEANCRACHFGANFSNGEFHDVGRPFFTGVGQVDPGRYAGIQRLRNDPYSLTGKHGVDVQTQQRLKTENVKLSQSNWGQWRTPSLRNLSLTAPYMHDGSLKTLRDVVDWYADIDVERLHSDGEAILKPLNLNDQQRNDLVVFLESLSVVK